MRSCLPRVVLNSSNVPRARLHHALGQPLLAGVGFDALAFGVPLVVLAVAQLHLHAVGSAQVDQTQQVLRLGARVDADGGQGELVVLVAGLAAGRVDALVRFAAGMPLYSQRRLNLL